jgi:hypothetical protein
MSESQAFLRRVLSRTEHDAETIQLTRGTLAQLLTDFDRQSARIAALETERESLVETVNILGDDETMWALEEVPGQESA